MQEDTKETNNSEIRIDHFSLLDNLIIVHGHNNLLRITKVVLLFFYKNIILTVVLFIYLFLSDYSATQLFNASLLVSYNIFFTTLPVLSIGFYDEDISASNMLEYPFFYK